MKNKLFFTTSLCLAFVAGILVSAYRASYADKNGEEYMKYKKIFEQDEVEEILFGRKLDPGRNGEYRIGIKCTEGIYAELSVYRAKDGRYEKLFTCPAVIGLNGPCTQAVGDNRTPVGSWVCGQALGIKPDPGSKIPYTQVTDDVYWRGDGGDPLYNTLVYRSDAPEKDYSQDEHIIDYGDVYNYILDMGYNSARAPYAGSALFLHCWRNPNHPTHGCVGVAEENMVRILRTITPGTVVTVY